MTHTFGKEIRFLLVGIGVFAILTFLVGAIFGGLVWIFGAPPEVILMVAYSAILLSAVALHLYAKQHKQNDEVYCPECGNKSRCYECASRGGWISKAEQDELDRDEDSAGLIIGQIEREIAA